MNKMDYFRGADQEFRDSDQDVDDYFNLIFKSNQCLRQGSGLLWSDIKDILDEVLNGPLA